MATAAVFVVGTALAADDVPPARKIDLLETKIERIRTKPFPSFEEQAELRELILDASEIDPADPRVLAWKADLLERDGKLPGAMELLEQAVATLRASNPLPPTPDARLLATLTHRLGQLQLAAGNADGASDLARQAIDADPDFTPAYELLLDTSYRSGAVFDTLELLKSVAAEATEPSDPRRLLYLELAAQLGDWDTVRAAVDDADTESSAAFRHHFLGLLAALEGDRYGGFLHHFVASRNGDWRSRTTRRSGEAVTHMLRREPRLEGDIKELVQAVTLVQRRESASEALALLAGLPRETPLQRLVVDHLRGEALIRLYRLDEARKVYESLVAEFPHYVPAVCGLAAVVEGQGNRAEARKLYEQARRIQPHAREVWKLFRMGAEFGLTEEGVEALAVREGSPWYQFSLRPGDEILELDTRPLTEEPPLDRLRWARLFQGGRVKYRTSDGTVLVDELELELFDD